MNQLDPIKFVTGLDEKNDPDLSQGFQEAEDLDFGKLGTARAVLDNDVGTIYGSTVHSMSMEGLATTDPLLCGVGTSLFLGNTALKTNFSGKDLSFSALSGNVYMTNETDGLWYYDGGGTLYRAGAPTAGSSFTAGLSAGTGFTGDYSFKVTFVNDNGFDGNPSDAVAATTAANQNFALSNLPLNANGDYNVTARHIWIQGGTSPVYSDYVLAKTISDNTTTGTTVDLAEVDASVGLEDDNDTAPAGSFIFEAYGVMFMGGITGDEQSLRFSKLLAPEQWPLTQELNVSRSSDPIRGGVAWNGSSWIATAKKMFQLIGSPGSGTLITNFYIKETKATAGTISGRSLVPTPYGLFYWAEDGIRMFDGDTSVVVSDPVEDTVAGRNQTSAIEKQITGVFHDDKLIYSFASAGSDANDTTIVYDFRTKAPTTHGKGYRSFAADRKTNLLHLGTTSSVERFRQGSTYRSWAIRKNARFTSPTAYSAFAKFQVDLEGSCTAEVYLDGTLSQSYAISGSPRAYVTRRFPRGIARRADLRLSGSSKPTQDVIHSLAISAEPTRAEGI